MRYVAQGALGLLVLALTACGVQSATLAPTPSASDQFRTAVGSVPLGDASYQLWSTTVPWRIYPGAFTQPAAALYQEISAAADRADEVGHMIAARYATKTQANQTYNAILSETGRGSDLAYGERGTANSQDGFHDVAVQDGCLVIHVSGPTPSLTESYARAVYDAIATTYRACD